MPPALGDMGMREHQSPIKQDSQGLRAEREQYLQSFAAERKTPRQQAAKESQERIKKESEYLRIQRENFLNGFSTPHYGHSNNQQVMPNLQNMRLNLPQ